MENQKKSHGPATMPLDDSVSINEDGTISIRTKLTVTVLENNEITLNVNPATDLLLANYLDTEKNVGKSNKKEKKKKSALFDCIMPHTDSNHNKNDKDINVLRISWDSDKKLIDKQKTTKRLNLTCVPSCEEICCKDESSVKKPSLEVIDAPLNKKSESIDGQVEKLAVDLVGIPKQIGVKEKDEIGSKMSENETESNRVELFYNDEMEDLQNMFVQYKNDIQDFDPLAVSENDISKLYIFIDEIAKEPKINCNWRSQVEIVLVDKDT